MKSKGLGDTIEKITTATGIKKATEYVFDKLGVDCGCEARKEKLNKMFPYKDPECLMEDEYLWLKDYFGVFRSKIKREDQMKMLEIFNRVFKTNKKPSSCSSCVKDLYQQLEKLFKEYEEKKD